MKKLIRNIALLSIGIFSFTSCADFIDNAPDDTLTMEMVFNDKVRMEDWFAGVYTKVPDPYWGFLRDYGYDVLGDDLDPSQRWQQWWGGSVLNFIIGQWYTNSSWNGDVWAGCPIRIRSAYQFIENAHALPDQGVSQERIDDMKNQCRFLIAYYYWLMIEAHGAVPFFDGLANVEDPNLMRGQETFDFMVNWIDGQLTELAKVLPATRTNTYLGEATSIMCLAVRARMLLFAASPLVNGNTMYAGHVNHDGEEIFNQVYDPNKWNIAAQACKELIDAAEAAGHSLYYAYNDDGTLDPFMSCYGAVINQANMSTNSNPEALFIRPSSDYSQFEGHSTPRGANGNGGNGIYQTLVDAFFMKDGTSPIIGYNGDYGHPIINPDSPLYSESGFSTAPDVRKTKYDLYRGYSGNTMRAADGSFIDDEYVVNQQIDGATYNQVAAKGTFNMYVNREPRFYLAVMWNEQWYHQVGRNTDFYSNGVDGGPTHDAPQGGYLNRKKVSLDQNNRDGQHPYRPGILYRLGEAYLNYAEALNECDPGNPDILKYLNAIRYRAGVPQYGTGTEVICGETFNQLPVPASQEEMREAIRRERRVELCCEDGIRYFDLRRWMLAEEVLNQPTYGMNFGQAANTVTAEGGYTYTPQESREKYFTRTVEMANRHYEKKYYWFPIFQTEIDKDPTLVQSPFWDEE